MKPLLADLCCGAGGATAGYQRAGFYVVGVDIEPQRHYCGDEFVQMDALDFDLSGFDAVHASPPCQHYANVTKWRGDQADHPDLIPLMLDRLAEVGVPWVVENVPGAPILADFMLCGSHFGLPVRRHRWFMAPWAPLILKQPCRHSPTDLAFEHKQERAYADAMGCDWMSSIEAREAVPPVYTEHIGRYLRLAIEVAA